MTITDDILAVVAPANDVAGPAQGQWTYADYAALPDDGRRYEIIDGVLYMAPAPIIAYQSSNMRFAYYLFQHIELKGKGRVLAAPIDVKFNEKNTVQPDVVVVLNVHLSRITAKNIEGAPDLIVEIASPGTVGYDRRNKQDMYERYGVAEYWIADPAAHTVEGFIPKQGAYQSVGVLTGKATLPSQIVPGLPVSVEDFFA